MVRAVGVGAGGHAKVVMDVVRAMGGVEIVGLLDRNPALWETEVLGVAVLGGDDLLGQLFQDGIRHAFIGVGGADDTRPRRLLYTQVRAAGFAIVAAVHPKAVIAPSAVLGDGPTVMASAVINAGARLGDNVLINTGAIVEHDCVIGSHAHIATGARLASTVTVGEGAHIGLGAAVRQGITIGRGAVVGAGAVVVDDVPEGVVVAGVPARILSRRET